VTSVKETHIRFIYSLLAEQYLF